MSYTFRNDSCVQVGVGVIEYVDCVASFRVVCDKRGWEEPIHLDVTLEVLGNIYENPEILE